VVDPDSGLARCATAPATSRKVTIRPVAWRASRAAFSATGSGKLASIWSTKPVWTVPGLTQFTRIPSATWSAIA